MESIHWTEHCLLVDPSCTEIRTNVRWTSRIPHENSFEWTPVPTNSSIWHSSKAHHRALSGFFQWSACLNCASKLVASWRFFRCMAWAMRWKMWYQWYQEISKETIYVMPPFCGDVCVCGKDFIYTIYLLVYRCLSYNLRCLVPPKKLLVRRFVECFSLRNLCLSDFRGLMGHKGTVSTSFPLRS